MYGQFLTATALVGAAVSPAQDTGAPPGVILVDPSLRVTLFASEPDVVDPVALCFDEAGKLYVVEMRDYPYGSGPDGGPGGTVRLLEDTDGDGTADRSSLFAEGLGFPTSIAPWRNGVIVAASPALVFLADTDGDGQADEQRELYSGFVRGVTDSNMSGLRWGPDNWLHGVNGGNGGTVRATGGGGGDGGEVVLRDLDFRVRPDSGEAESTYSTGGGFGLVFDDWGRSFTPHNINHIQMRVLPARSARHTPGLRPVNGTGSISDHGDMARIFPISAAQTRPNHPEQAGHFSAAGGMGYIGNQDFPDGLAGSLLVGDVVGNLVHRDVLTDGGGPVPVASRAPGEMESEFLASTDPEFRPTGFELGPDGALYLLDMQRAVIEHPDYIPAKMRERLDIRSGENRGRIYRIAPAAGLPEAGQPLSELGTAGLVVELASRNQWRRATAQRLLVESGAPEAVPLLAAMLDGHADPRARLHALWTLDGLGQLGRQLILDRLSDPHPAVVANAASIGGSRLGGDPEFIRRVRGLSLDHPSAPVRFYAVLASGAGGGTGLGPDEIARVLLRDGQSGWARAGALASYRGDPLELLDRVVGSLDGEPNPASGRTVLSELADLAGARLPDRAPAAWGSALAKLASPDQDPANVVAVLEGVRGGLARREGPQADGGSYQADLETLASLDPPIATMTAVWSLERALGLPASKALTEALTAARTLAADPSIPIEPRLEAIALLSLDELDPALPVLLECLRSPAPEEVQRAALEVLSTGTDRMIADGLVRGWSSLHPQLRRPVTLLLLRKRDYHPVLLDAIEGGGIAVGELNLDLEDRRTLLRWSTPDIQRRSAALLGDGEYGNRQAKVDEWLAGLPATGDPERGRAVFERACASCHRAAGLGYDVGPDLSGMSHRSTEDLVSNILDPNMAINPNYLAVIAGTENGDLVTGILRSETPGAITLLQQGGTSITLAREDLARVESTGMSLMPEGLESTFSPQDLRDLVEFMQVP